jgi:hypothetical protein
MAARKVGAEPAGDERNGGHRRYARTVWHCARCDHGARCQRACGCFMDCRAADPCNIGASLTSGLGARAGTRALHHGVLRLPDNRQRGLGQKLQTGAGVDLTPSMHWPAPLTAQPIEQDRGPILVTVEYHIRPQDRPEFLQVLVELGRERRRDGAYRWGVFENAAEEGRIVETFLVASWMEHLRQHERVTNADRLVQECVVRFHMGDEPKVTHFIAANP